MENKESVFCAGSCEVTRNGHIGKNSGVRICNMSVCAVSVGETESNFNGLTRFARYRSGGIEGKEACKD